MLTRRRWTLKFLHEVCASCAVEWIDELELRVERCLDGECYGKLHSQFLRGVLLISTSSNANDIYDRQKAMYIFTYYGSTYHTRVFDIYIGHRK